MGKAENLFLKYFPEPEAGDKTFSPEIALIQKQLEESREKAKSNKPICGKLELLYTKHYLLRALPKLPWLSNKRGRLTLEHPSILEIFISNCGCVIEEDGNLLNPDSYCSRCLPKKGIFKHVTVKKEKSVFVGDIAYHFRRLYDKGPFISAEYNLTIL